MNSLEWLQQWYLDQCDDEWEHQFGVVIETLDNPGWLVKNDLAGMSMQGVSLRLGDEQGINHQGVDGAQDWLTWVRSKTNNLSAREDLSRFFPFAIAFRRWVEHQKERQSPPSL
jgi:hypothetical protein